MRVCQVFYSSLPSSKGGDIRSRDIVHSLFSIGVEVFCVTSPFQPPTTPGEIEEMIDGVTYKRNYKVSSRLVISEDDQGLLVKIRKLLTLFEFSRALTAIVREEEPDVIHAHSTFYCAIGAWYAARACNVPFIYEVRSLWEERSAMKEESKKNKLIRGVIRKLETISSNLSDHLVVISKELKNEMVRRGVPQGKISVIGNGVDLSRMSRHNLYRKYKEIHPSELVFGYVGNLSDIEGLDLFISSVRVLRKKGWSNKVVIFGGGPASTDLRRLACNIVNIYFYGEFRPNSVADVYRNIDIVVNPRRSSSLTEVVTPLKPLEAMAYRKIVIVSSVGGMKELVTDKMTGFIFKSDDLNSLVEVIQSTTGAGGELDKIAEHAFEYIKREKSWQVNAEKLLSIYKKLSVETKID